VNKCPGSDNTSGRLSPGGFDIGLGDDRIDPLTRDVLVSSLTSGDDWLSALPVLIPPPKGKEYFVMGPEEYSMLMEGLLSFPQGQVLVDGDLQIMEKKWHSLPRTVVRGSVLISDCPNLGAVEIINSGWFSISECPALKAVRGEVFGPATIKSCGIERIGADFRVTHSLFLQMCPQIGSLNCEVGEGLEARGCGVVKTGPAFKAGKYALVDACKGLCARMGTVANHPLNEEWGGARQKYIAPVQPSPLALPSPSVLPPASVLTAQSHRHSCLSR